MADQYRLSGEFAWMANSGNALIAIANPVGSNKKLVVKSFEIACLASLSTASVAAAVAKLLTLSRATVAGGETKSTVSMDSAADPLPSTIRVATGSTVESPTNIGQVGVLKQANVVSLAWGLARQRLPGRLGGIARRRRGGYAESEGLILRAGESLALYDPTFAHSTPLRVHVRLALAGTPDRTYESTYYTNLLASGAAALSITNEAGSGEVVTILSISLEEVGSFETPYFQLVPAGAINPDSAVNELDVVTALKLDTASPDHTAAMKIYTDVQILPYGLPENALSDASTGSPRGFSYLKTKDFLGPVYRVLFPEYVGIKPGLAPDGLGHALCGHMSTDMGIRGRRGRQGADITVREGEIIALVSAAETAAGAASAVGSAGWASYHFAVTLSVEPKAAPTLSLTGLKNPTEIRIFDAGTTTQITGQEDVTSGTFSWVYDPELYPLVDISILALGYQNTRLTNIALGFTDVTIPVQQQLDRQYRNP